jgi:RNA polymerase sigma-70 factor, ECF subfamily
MRNKRKNIDLYLLMEAQKGNERAFEALFNYYHNAIFAYVLKIVKNTDDAADITMMTFEKAFTKAHKYRPSSGFSSWISKIARNTAIDFLLYNKRRPDKVDLDNQNLPSLLDTPEELLINKQTGEIVDNSVNELRKNYKDIIELRYYNDCSYDEMCSKLNITGNDARVQLFRAKKELGKILNKYSILNYVW